MTHIHAIINSQKIPRKWSKMTSWSKSANTCNFEGCSKLKTSKFQWWQFFISYPNVFFFFFFSSKCPTWSPFQQLHQVEFSKNWHFIWNLGMFVRLVHFFLKCDNFGQMSIKGEPLQTMGPWLFSWMERVCKVGVCVYVHSCTRDGKTLFWSHVGFVESGS